MKTTKKSAPTAPKPVVPSSIIVGIASRAHAALEHVRTAHRRDKTLPKLLTGILADAGTLAGRCVQLDAAVTRPAYEQAALDALRIAIGPNAVYWLDFAEGLSAHARLTSGEIAAAKLAGSKWDNSNAANDAMNNVWEPLKQGMNEWHQEERPIDTPARATSPTVGASDLTRIADVLELDDTDRKVLAAAHHLTQCVRILDGLPKDTTLSDKTAAEVEQGVRESDGALHLFNAAEDFFRDFLRRVRR